MAGSRAANLAAAKRRRVIREQNFALDEAERTRRVREDYARSLFAPAKPPPGVVPEGHQVMAMDDAGSGSWGNWASQANLSWTEGTVFLGYPYLSQITQRHEYYRGAKITADDATRKWIAFESTGEKKKADKVQRLERRLEEMRVRDHVHQMVVDDCYFGRGHLYLDINGAWDKPLELPTDIGNGRTETSEIKVGSKSPLSWVKTIEPIWTYPQAYNAINPLRQDWYNPTTWYVMGQQVHGSRLLTLVTRPVPDLLKPAYSFGGYALSQQMKDDVDIWRRTRDGVGDMIQGYSQYVLKTDLSVRLQEGGAEGLDARVSMFTAMRDNRGLHVLDKDKEELESVSQSLGGLDLLQAQAQEHVATSAGFPLVRFIGDQPAGLNASSEGAIRFHYDGVKAYQEAHLRPIVQTIVDMVQLSEFGELDPDITFQFVPLWEMSEKEMAEIDKLEAETDNLRIDGGILDPAEVRVKVIENPRGDYQGLDPNAVPDLSAEEDDGLDPEALKSGGG